MKFGEHADFIVHLIGMMSFISISVVFWGYSQHAGKNLLWILNGCGISFEILGFLLMLWAGTRTIILPRGILETLNSDDTPNNVVGSPHPTTWAMGIVFIVIGLILQLISSW